MIWLGLLSSYSFILSLMSVPDVALQQRRRARQHNHNHDNTNEHGSSSPTAMAGELTCFGASAATTTNTGASHVSAVPDPESSLSLSSRYFRRLGIDDPPRLDADPTLDKLKVLQERHLATIPFENLSQHGLELPAILDVEATARKILDRNRGGFCFEVNGLFAAFLVELGYDVVMLPAQLYRGTQFDVPTHLVLVVTCYDGTVAFVDVGFGEPPIHPLLYDDLSGACEQVTPEGMRSKLVRNQDDDQGDAVYLYWHKSGEWVPRLRWAYHLHSVGGAADPRMTLRDFHPYLNTVRQPESNFSKKLICCILAKDRKISLAGNRLKITGRPRFPEVEASVEVKELDSVDAVRQALQDHFGIPLAESATLDLSKSLATDAVVWAHM
jgi:N-hydroxyarylamine O-acetyltransferase